MSCIGHSSLLGVANRHVSVCEEYNTGLVLRNDNSEEFKWLEL